MNHETTETSVAQPSRGVQRQQTKPNQWTRSGKMRTGILLWALGIPIPLVLLFVLLRGCA